MDDTNNRKQTPIEELRQKVIKKLEANYAHGFMNLEEFEKQLEMVVHTTLLEDLSRISANLETISSDREAPRSNSVNTGDIEPDGTIFCFMGGVKRKGKWSPARNNKVFSLMGGIDLDFSEALLPPGETVFDFFCMMSG
ncbi:MAG: hypothetical protein JEY91_09415, partial [Spirochaetaceae bacterium]|nr:hypothetical protein [Spirochaetaceae bacterium]